MATVKTQGGKVILKDGKVSCECCEEPGECCMYPADRLWPDSADPAFFTFDDLPDALELETESEVVIYNKDIQNIEGLTWKLYQSEDDEEERIIWNSDEVPYGTLGCNSGNGPRYAAVPGVGGVSCCLIGGGSIFKDQFADTYTVTINPPDNNAGTYTVTRRSICVWSTQVEESGEPAGLKLSYIDAVIGGGFAYTWEIELDTSYIKDGFANTPTGDYAEGNASVS